MKSPVAPAAGFAESSDDGTGGRGQPVFMGVYSGIRPGRGLRFSAPPAAQNRLAGRWIVSVGGNLGLGVSGIRNLPGRAAAGVHRRSCGRRIFVGMDSGMPAASGFWMVLEGILACRGYLFPAFQKIIPFFKNFVCIWGKMGYNKVEKSSAAPAKNRRCFP